MSHSYINFYLSINELISFFNSFDSARGVKKLHFLFLTMSTLSLATVILYYCCKFL